MGFNSGVKGLSLEYVISSSVLCNFVFVISLDAYLLQVVCWDCSYFVSAVFSFFGYCPACISWL